VNKNLKKAKMKEVPKDSKEVKDKDNAMKEPKGQNLRRTFGRQSLQTWRIRLERLSRLIVRAGGK
jgi:hypothetical protein